MATQVLAGSKGNYKPISASPQQFGETEFTVTHDTCMQAESVPVKFKDAAEGCKIPMKNVKFAMDAKYKEY